MVGMNMYSGGDINHLKIYSQSITLQNNEGGDD